MPEPNLTPAAHANSKMSWWYILLLVLTTLMWAGQGTAVKFLDPFLKPIAITFLPFYVTTLLLIPILFVYRMNHPGSAAPSGRDWLRFGVAGIGGQVLAQLGMTWGISLSLASNGAILNLLIPVISAVLASVMLRERVTALRWVCLAIGLVGVLMMSTTDLEQSSFGRGYLTGNLLILAGCCGSSFYNVYCKGLMARFSEFEILIYSYFTATIASIPLLVWVEPLNFESLLRIDTNGWLAFGFLAIFMYGASMLLFFYVLEHVPVTVASASLYFVPIFGVALAVTILGEQLNATTIAGGVIVLASTWLIMRYDTGSG